MLLRSSSPVRRRLAAAGAALLAAGVAGAVLAVPASAAAPADGDYIVVLKDSVAHPSAVAAEHRRKHGAQVTFTYGSALKGYAARLSGQGLGEVMRDKRVAYVERDQAVQASAVASWGLDRSDQRLLPLDASYTAASTGAGVTAYVIDTGIRYTHSDFGGRARFGYDAFTDGQQGDDCNGHGTHVAGTIGGTTYGIAPAVGLVAVRVLDCGGSGTWSGVIAGLDWVTADHGSGAAVANMSLGGGASTAVDDAVKRMIADGVTTAVAAGNGNAGGKAQDACNYSPARVPEALTIGATAEDDAKASFSNYGSCVDFFAPGVRITSAWYTGDTATNTISGTSMAAPHVAGAAALYLQAGAATPLAVESFLEERTTKNIVTSSKTLASNDLLYIGTADDPGLLDPTTSGGGKPAKSGTK